MEAFCQESSQYILAATGNEPIFLPTNLFISSARDQPRVILRDANGGFLKNHLHPDQSLSSSRDGRYAISPGITLVSVDSRLNAKFLVRPSLGIERCFQRLGLDLILNPSICGYGPEGPILSLSGGRGEH